MDKITPCASSEPIPVTATAVSSMSASQVTALEWFTAGEPIGVAAAAAGVHPSSVYRWLKTDTHFQAAFNAWKDQVQAAAKARLTSMTDLAVGVINKALLAGDTRVAVTVLKERGLLKPDPAGATDAQVLAAEAAIEHRNTARRFAQAEMESYGP